MFLRALLDTLFPPLCHVCRTFIPGPAEVHLCASCRDAVSPIRPPLCPVCGTPFAAEGGIDHPCGPCLTDPRPFDGARSAVRFDGPVRDLIHRFKFGKKSHLARPLALLTARSLPDFPSTCPGDLVVPVPLHVKRLRQRGFNQSQLLGHVLAKEWRIPLSVHNLRRIRWTEPQIGLSATERERNVRNAFAVAHPHGIEDKSIILADDVFTTGSTVSECARILKRAGARQVWVITVARAVP